MTKSLFADGKTTILEYYNIEWENTYISRPQYSIEQRGTSEQGRKIHQRIETQLLESNIQFQFKKYFLI